MALFPFLIVVTSLAGFVGSANLADEVARLIVGTWPQQVSGPIAGEIRHVLTTARGGVLTIGAVLSVYFASSGVESLRIGLNRAYGLRRGAQLVAVAAGIDRLRAGQRHRAVGAFLSGGAGAAGVSGGRRLCAVDRAAAKPITMSRVSASAAASSPSRWSFCICGCRPGGGGSAPSRPALPRRWCCGSPCGFAFGRYLADFAYTYVTYYGGLASAMVALVFLYYSAWIFIYGGELNAAIARVREGK